ncbi:hypothetical protein TELCIR_16844 [Teladorsagia circumcincta]|uniref:Small ribosomal subunit protein uS10 domain-containing protein n=1 Tax=Teladorsagia circumcincta TaxID=45464 RepID=A0A2G9TUL9_TELCI|nr:hypothetical protein TELCIR_16844 [Teladorsagia circumcincta]
MFPSIYGYVRNAVQSLLVNGARLVRTAAAPSVSKGLTTPSEAQMPDKLFSSIELEYRGHDPEVLKSYTKFLEVLNLTGSTASTFLEYIERNIPEGVGMRVGYVEMQPLPPTITSKQ